MTKKYRNEPGIEWSYYAWLGVACLLGGITAFMIGTMWMWYTP